LANIASFMYELQFFLRALLKLHRSGEYAFHLNLAIDDLFSPDRHLHPKLVFILVIVENAVLRPKKSGHALGSVNVRKSSPIQIAFSLTVAYSLSCRSYQLTSLSKAVFSKAVFNSFLAAFKLFNVLPINDTATGLLQKLTSRPKY